MPPQKNKLDMLIYKRKWELLLNSITGDSHFMSHNMSWEEGFKSSGTFLMLETIQQSGVNVSLIKVEAKKTTKEGQVATFSCGLTIRQGEQQGRAE